MRIKRNTSISLEDLLSIDKRLPIVYLRSFKDDNSFVEQKLHIPGQGISNIRGNYTMEDVVVSVLRNRGPVVAIGIPGERLPPSGAGRVYVDDDKWREVIRDYISKARHVIVLLGETSGLSEEYRYILESRKLYQTIFLFPKDCKSQKSLWSKIVATIGLQIIDNRDLPNSKTMAAIFRRNGDAVFINGNSDYDKDSLQFALFAALKNLANNEMQPTQ